MHHSYLIGLARGSLRSASAEIEGVIDAMIQAADAGKPVSQERVAAILLQIVKSMGRSYDEIGTAFEDTLSAPNVVRLDDRPRHSLLAGERA